MGKRNQNKNKKKKKAAAAGGAERGRSENSAAAAAAVSPSPQKSSKKKKKELTVGEKMCESYARFEDYIEDWEKLSAVGEKAVRQLSGKIPAIENFPLMLSRTVSGILNLRKTLKLASRYSEEPALPCLSALQR